MVLVVTNNKNTKRRSNRFSMINGRITGAIFLLTSLACAVFLTISNNEQGTGSLLLVESEEEKQLKIATSRPKLPDDLSSWDTCDINMLCPRRKSSTNLETLNPKPLYIAGCPMSGDEILRPKVIDTIHGLAMARSYYSTRSKKCATNIGVYATCSSIHPIVGMRRNPLDRISEFNNNILFTIRNPAVEVAAYFQMKANLYHQVVGQVNESEWQAFRDSYVKTLENNNTDGSPMQTWIDMITTWKSYTESSYYNITYIQYEKLFSFETGPAIIQRLINIFDQAGFTNLPDIANNNDDENNNNKDDGSENNNISCIQCLWYQTVTKERIIQYNKYGYEFSDYMPGYTLLQRNTIIHQLTELYDLYSSDDESKADPALVDILKEYIYEVKNHIKIESEE